MPLAPILLGFRTLEQPRGRDVWQLNVILHALGHYMPDKAKLDEATPQTS